MSDEKIKEVDRPKIPEKVRDDLKPQKEGRSQFDKILEQNKLLQQSPKQTQMAMAKGSEQEARVVRREDQGDRGKDKQDDRDGKKDEGRRTKEERKANVVTDKGIAGGERTKSGTDGGGGKGAKGQGFGGATQRKVSVDLKKSFLSRAADALAEGNKFISELRSQMKTAHLTKEFVSNIVNQIVKFVRAGVSYEGFHEVRLDLHEKIFKGLQLRVALKHGKVSIQFNTSNREVRDLFKSGSESIQKELEAKGILVSEIKVT